MVHHLYKHPNQSKKDVLNNILQPISIHNMKIQYQILIIIYEDEVIIIKLCVNLPTIQKIKSPPEILTRTIKIIQNPSQETYSPTNTEEICIGGEKLL